MLNNMFLVLSGSSNTEPTEKIEDYIWSAFELTKQNNYHYATTQSGIALAQSPDNVYDPDKNDVSQPPHLYFKPQVPEVLDPDNPELARWNVLPSLEAGHAAMSLESHPVIAYPVEEGKELIISMEAQFMVLLPTDETKNMSVQPLFRWRPYPGSYETVSANFLRDDEGETYIDLIHYDYDYSAHIAQFPFSQWKLNDSRMVFRLVVRSDQLEFFVNGESIGTMEYRGYESGPGDLTILYPQQGEQGANIAEPHLIRVHRRTVE